MKIQRAQPLLIEFDRPEWQGKSWVVPPLTRRQARAIFALDPDGGDALESPAANEKRIAAQVKIAVESALELDPETDRPIAGTSLPIAELTGDEERAILTAIVSQHRGQDPKSALAVRAVLKKNALLSVLAAAHNSSSGSTKTAEP